MPRALQDAEVNKERNKGFQEERSKGSSASETAAKKQKRCVPLTFLFLVIGSLPVLHVRCIVIPFNFVPMY